MDWIRMSDSEPTAEVLIYTGGEYRIAVLGRDGDEPAFVDVHSSDLLPWPSHWMALERPRD